MMQLFGMITVVILLMNNLIACTESKSVRIALPSWEGGQFVAYDLGTKIEKTLGISIKYVEIEGDPMWVELDKDNGKIDVFPWMPNQEKTGINLQ